jgi:hypothetical protein
MLNHFAHPSTPALQEDDLACALVMAADNSRTTHNMATASSVAQLSTLSLLPARLPARSLQVDHPDRLLLGERLRLVVHHLRLVVHPFCPSSYLFTPIVHTPRRRWTSSPVR